VSDLESQENCIPRSVLPGRRVLRQCVEWLCAALIVVVLAVLLFVAYIWWGHTSVLDRKIASLHVVELQHGKFAVVRITGLSGESACSVKKITSHVEDGTITVFVHLFLARKGTTGSFQYDVHVPESVNEIRFGKKRELIWSRESGPVLDAPGSGKSP
jgi:hypothetical protein